MRIVVGLGLLTIGLTAASAWAQPDLRLNTQMFVERVTADINGRPRRILSETGRAASGDQMIVVVHWRNDGRDTVRDRMIVRPVPRGAQIDLTDPSMEVSVDGGTHWGRVDTLWLPTPLGGIRRATATDISHVRWRLPAGAPGETGRLSYRATMR